MILTANVLSHFEGSRSRWQLLRARIENSNWNADRTSLIENCRSISISLQNFEELWLCSSISMSDESRVGEHSSNIMSDAERKLISIVSVSWLIRWERLWRVIIWKMQQKSGNQFSLKYSVDIFWHFINKLWKMRRRTRSWTWKSRCNWRQIKLGVETRNCD